MNDKTKTNGNHRDRQKRSRRVEAWLSEEEWRWLGDVAADEGSSMSEVLRRGFYNYARASYSSADPP